MSWYHAENNERRGPIDETSFNSLVSAGTIGPATLVWREGMPAWVPYAELPPALLLAFPAHQRVRRRTWPHAQASECRCAVSAPGFSRRTR